ncbi:MAG: methyltransferase FkbM family [Deltaproteobacteria bacterium]|nr:methyltransferase FkbM family [Deltaproteobacteria bacterium]
MKARIAESFIAALSFFSRAVPRAWIPRLAMHASRFSPMAHLIPPGNEILFRRYLGKYTVAIDTRYAIEKGVLVGRYEPHLIRFIRDFVPNGGTVVDVGANIGAITFALADRVGPKGCVYAFEPGPPVYRRLTRNLGLNPGVGSIVFPFQFGLSDAPGAMTYREFPHCPGDGSLHDAGGTTSDGEHPVPVTTLDLFLQKRGIDRLDFIKIDVEGMERRVLAGGMGMVRRFRPVLHVETFPSPDGRLGRENFAGIRDLLSPLGYELFRAGENGKLVPADPSRFDVDTFALPRGMCRANASPPPA